MKLHIEKAKHNEAFLELIEKQTQNDFTDWKITVIFYISLHYFKAYFKFLKISSGNSHTEIQKILVEKCKVPKNISDNYFELYDYSRISRYIVYQKTDFQKLLESVQYNDCKQILKNIKEYLKQFIDL